MSFWLQGCLKPVTTIIPRGSMLDPSENAAVVGGNVLTSQRIVDVILMAFQICAASQVHKGQQEGQNQALSYDFSLSFSIEPGFYFWSVVEVEINRIFLDALWNTLIFFHYNPFYMSILWWAVLWYRLSSISICLLAFSCLDHIFYTVRPKTIKCGQLMHIWGRYVTNQK